MLCFIRFAVIGILPITLAACANPPPATAETGAVTTAATGIDLGSSAARSPRIPVAVRPGEGQGQRASASALVQLADADHSGVHATGTINSIDPAGRKVNISHGPIVEIGWPAMTMDLPVAASVNLQSVKPGTRVNFGLDRGRDGMYQIGSIVPAGGGR